MSHSGFPLVSGSDGLAYGAEAIRGLLARELGDQRLITLREEIDRRGTVFGAPNCYRHTRPHCVRRDDPRVVGLF
jgi:hypothetical protein